MITGKTLYDSDGNQFYPYSDSEYISSGVVVSSNMLKDDLKAIWAKAQSAYSKASGEETINGQLQIDVYYKNSTESSEENVIAEGENEWNETMTPPDSSAPYCWKRTRYYWIVDDSVPTPFKTLYEICATALYPETQTMYAVTALVNSDAIGGPSDYSTDISGVADKTENSIKWYSYFPGISAVNTMGYMATRHRDAGENWPEEGGWKVALFAVYPTT